LTRLADTQAHDKGKNTLPSARLGFETKALIPVGKTSCETQPSEGIKKFTRDGGLPAENTPERVFREGSKHGGPGPISRKTWGTEKINKNIIKRSNIIAATERRADAFAYLQSSYGGL